MSVETVLVAMGAFALGMLAEGLRVRVKRILEERI